jgi:hypothetical protein
MRSNVFSMLPSEGQSTDHLCYLYAPFHLEIQEPHEDQRCTSSHKSCSQNKNLITHSLKFLKKKLSEKNDKE